MYMQDEVESFQPGLMFFFFLNVPHEIFKVPVEMNKQKCKYRLKQNITELIW